MLNRLTRWLTIATLFGVALPATSFAAKPLYLALGDSVPVWNGPQSYPNLVQKHIGKRVHGVVLENLAISGETTESMLSGQYGRALTALRHNRGHVALITIDIGGNDVVGCAFTDFPTPGPGSDACWSHALATMEHNVSHILRGLRGAAPHVPIIGMSYYNPLLGNWLAGGIEQQTAVATKHRLVDLNQPLTRLYGGSRWTADVQGAFHALDLKTLVASPWGRVPLAVDHACAWLDIVCQAGSPEVPGDDPNTAGAAVIGKAFEQRIDALCRTRGASRRWLLCRSGRAHGAVSALGVRAPKLVHLRGTAYEFNKVHTMLAGATIRIAEYPKLSATVGSNGRYDLQVPDHARVTPYIVDPGYHSIYLQTFTTDSEDLANVNFQTPTDAVYKALAVLLDVPLDASGNPVQCAIVSTFNTRNVRDLSYQGFIAYGAHGVAGATASGSPALPKPVYFNQNVIPDPSQRVSSVDGGVVWTRVPVGVYTITAHSSTTRFARFVATCRPGRIVNANPPWGLHELGLRNPARATITWWTHGNATLLDGLRISHLPLTHTVVTARCIGRGCRLRARTWTTRGTTIDVGRAVGRLDLHAGQALEVSVTAHRYNGIVWRWTPTRTGAPRGTTLCIPLGNTLPRPRC